VASGFISNAFAPPLDADKLNFYADLISQLPGDSRLGVALTDLHACVSKWWGLPESTGSSTPHPCGRGTVVTLDSDVEATLGPLTPQKAELAEMSKLLDTIPAGALRNAAFHLLWHVTELSLGREPITRDKLT